MNHINITKAAHSKIEEVDLSNLPFGKIFTDHMFIAEFSDGNWHSARIEPVHDLSLHPATMALHYGQTIFEGMKASITQDNIPMLMRSAKHLERFNRSAVRMCMPEIPAEIFIEGLKTLVSLESQWIPKANGSSLYLRPFMFSSDAFIGVAASNSYIFIILTLPVGPYYAKPIKLLAETKYVRASKGGVGEAKNGGNYGGSLYPSKLARAKGYDQVMWLDANNFDALQEVGTMNIFCVVDGKILTPALDGCILDGITRDCAIKILQNKGHEVIEKAISITDLSEAYDQGLFTEMFGTGTAAVVSQVELLTWKDKDFKFSEENFTFGNLVKREINGLRDGTVTDTYGWTEPIETRQFV